MAGGGRAGGGDVKHRGWTRGAAGKGRGGLPRAMAAPDGASRPAAPGAGTAPWGCPGGRDGTGPLGALRWPGREGTGLSPGCRCGVMQRLAQITPEKSPQQPMNALGWPGSAPRPLPSGVPELGRGVPGPVGAGEGARWAEFAAALRGDGAARAAAALPARGGVSCSVEEAHERAATPQK